jgi:hypothetical protein
MPHAHAYSPPPLLFSMLRRLNIRIIDIAVVDKHESLDPRKAQVFKDEEVQNRLAATGVSQEQWPCSLDIDVRSRDMG